MKLTRDEIVDDSSLLSHLVLEALSRYNPILEKVVAKGECEVQLLIDGQEVNIKPFIDHWQSQVGSMIKAAAVDEAKERLEPLDDLVAAIRQAVLRKGFLSEEELDSIRFGYSE